MAMVVSLPLFLAACQGSKPAIKSDAVSAKRIAVIQKNIEKQYPKATKDLLISSVFTALDTYCAANIFGCKV